MEERKQDDKLGKVVKLLKELEEKYKKALKDKAVLFDFTKLFIPSQYHAKLPLDTPVGQLELAPLQEILQAFKEEERSAQANVTIALESEVKAWRDQLQVKTEEHSKQIIALEQAYRLKITELEDKIKAMDKQIRSHDSERANIDANALLLKMKRSNSGNNTSASANALAEKSKKAENLQAKLDEKNEIILKLKSELNAAQSIVLKHTAASCIVKSNTESQTEEAPAVDGVESYSKLKEKHEYLLDSFNVLLSVSSLTQ